jgi:hypothetical protein
MRDSFPGCCWAPAASGAAKHPAASATMSGTRLSFICSLRAMGRVLKPCPGGMFPASIMIHHPHRGVASASEPFNVPLHEVRPTPVSAAAAGRRLHAEVGQPSHVVTRYGRVFHGSPASRRIIDVEDRGPS